MVPVGVDERLGKRPVMPGGEIASGNYGMMIWSERAERSFREYSIAFRAWAEVCGNEFELI